MSATSPDVLIVEDDGPTQSFLRTVCRRFGYAARVAGDGDAAMRQLDCGMEWRVILLDLYLPKASGFEVIAHMKENAPFFLSRTIVVTAAGERDILRARNLKLVHCVLRKPIDLNELTDRMMECAAQPATWPPVCT